MADEYRKLTRDELSELAGEELPERAAMSLVNANIAIPDQRRRRGERPFGQRDRVCERWPRPETSLRGTDMSEQQDYRKLTREELNELAGEELPERAAMSL